MTYVSDVIKYEQDIEPYRIIQIYAGVGAGKNAWVAKLVESGKRVLLVTSRKATADAQANKLEGCRWINLDEIQKPEGNNAVVVTNAGIEKYIKHKYNKDDEKTHLWKYFDIVVIDEAHSLAADAQFSDAPFYTMTFITKAYRESQCKIILMTGTPDQLDSMLNEAFKESPKYNFKNIYENCTRVYPEEVLFSGNKNLICQYLAGAINDNKRVIYFANTISGIAGIIKDLKSFKLNERYIGVAFSGSPKKEAIPKEILSGMSRIQESIAKSERIPDDIRLFITTSKCKEGINILDDNIEFMVVEANDKCSLIQMAGRARHGLKRLIVLYNAAQNEADELIQEEEILHKHCLPTINNDFKPQGWIENGQIIGRIETHFPYIRYDYFEKRFQIYLGKICGIKQILNDRVQMRKNISNYINYKKSPDDLKQWFPDSQIRIEPPWSKEAQVERFKAETVCYLKANGYTGRTITKEEKTQLRQAILRIASKYEMKTIGISPQAKNLSPLLKRVGYKIEEIGKHDGSKFVLNEIENEIT